MLRLNSKKVNAKLHTYILDAWNDSSYVLGGDSKPVETWEQASKEFVKLIDEDLKFIRPFSERFNTWCDGGCDIVPSIYYFELQQWLKDLLEMSQEEFNNLEDIESWELTKKLLYREVVKGARV